jgi:hypothetical protein
MRLSLFMALESALTDLLRPTKSGATMWGKQRCPAAAAGEALRGVWVLPGFEKFWNIDHGYCSDPRLPLRIRTNPCRKCLDQACFLDGS